MHTLLYLPYIFFILYLFLEFAARIIWHHTPHFTSAKTAALCGGTLTSIIMTIFNSPQTLPDTNPILYASYEVVSWATFLFFAIFTLVYIFEWVKDHRVAIKIERSFFRRGYEYAEAHARWLTASPLMILAAFIGLTFTICSIVLAIRVFGLY